MQWPEFCVIMLLRYTVQWMVIMDRVQYSQKTNDRDSRKASRCAFQSRRPETQLPWLIFVCLNVVRKSVAVSPYRSCLFLNAGFKRVQSVLGPLEVLARFGTNILQSRRLTFEPMLNQLPVYSCTSAQRTSSEMCSTHKKHIHVYNQHSCAVSGADR